MRISRLVGLGLAVIPAQAFGHPGHGAVTGRLHWIAEPEHVVVWGGVLVLAVGLLAGRQLARRRLGHR